MKIFSISITLLLLLSFSAFSDEKTTNESKKVLTVIESVKLAIDNNVSIKESEISVATTKRAKDHSWNSISPSISLSGEATIPNSKSTYDYSAYAEASINFSFSPSLFTDMKTAELNYEAGLISYEAACRSVELSVRTSFYGLLYEKEYITLQERNLETAKKQYETNLAKYRQGAISQLDVLTSQVSYEQLKPTLESAQVTWDNDMASFKQILGLNQDTIVELDGSLDNVMELGKITLDEVTAQSFDVKALEKKLELAKVAVSAEKVSAYAPSLKAGWAYEPSITSLTKNNPSDGGNLFVGVSIPLSVYLPWSSSADSIESAKDAVKNLELQLADEKTTVKVSSASYLRKINQAQATIKSLQANIVLAQKTYDMTLEAYNHGTKDFLSLQDAADSLLEAKVTLQSEAYTLISAVLNLENTVGVPFGTLGKNK